MVATRKRDVVQHLQPGVVVLDGQEERHPETVPEAEVHPGVGERPAGGGVDRPAVRPGSVLARDLEPELVRQPRRQEGGEAAVDGVGPIALEAVGAAAPGVHVEGPVLLLGPRVIVLERQIVPVGEPPVELHQGGPGVVGARDRPVVQAQRRRAERAAIGRIHPRAQRRAGEAPRVLLLDLVVDLLIVGRKEEQPVALDRAAEREPELVLAEIRHVGHRPVTRVGGEGVVLAEIVQRSAQLVRARLRDHVDEPARGASELGVRAARDHHHLLHRVEVEGERRPLAAALLAEERVVEVGAVHRDVVVNTALSRDSELVPIGALHDGDVGRQQGEVEVVAAVVGQARHRWRRQARRILDARGIHDGLGRRDGHSLHFHRPELELQVDRLPQAQRNAGLARLGEAHAPRRHVVRPERQQRTDEHTALVGPQGALESGLCLPQLHRGPHRRGSIRIEYDTADDAGRRLRLCVQRPNHGTAHHQRGQHDRNDPMQGSEHEESASWGDVHG